MVGGPDADVFRVNAAHQGAILIRDFEAGLDRLEVVSSEGVTSLADVTVTRGGPITVATMGAVRVEITHKTGEPSADDVTFLPAPVPKDTEPPLVFTYEATGTSYTPLQRILMQDEIDIARAAADDGTVSAEVTVRDFETDLRRPSRSPAPALSMTARSRPTPSSTPSPSGTVPANCW